MKHILFLDFLSHETMHLPFNQGHLQVLRFAFPDDRIIFGARSGHVQNLKAAFEDQDDIEFVEIVPFEVNENESSHNPIHGNRAANRCFKSAYNLASDKDVRLTALSGVDANLLRAFRKGGTSQSFGQLHYILHSQLSQSVQWRTRNPFLRWFDFLSEMRRGLPDNQKWIVLEHGIKDSVEDIAPRLKGSVLSLPHTILEEEWGNNEQRVLEEPVNVGFFGHCGRGKGFDIFVELADQFAGERFRFHAVGRANPNAADLDLSALIRKPVDGGVERGDYVKYISECDIALLPLQHTYNYVASGSVIDALGHLLPVVSNRTNTYQSIADEYGDFGVQADGVDGIRSFLKSFDVNEITDTYAEWKKNLTAIRQDRRPEALAVDYRKSILDGR